MRIAFWSETECSGTTFNMLAVAGMFSLLYPQEKVIVQSIEEEETKRKCRRAGQEAAASEICFMDCGSGMSERKYRMLAEASLVVVNLKQDREDMERLFLENNHWKVEPLFLLGNYYGHSQYCRTYLERTYRIMSDCICVISHNGEFAQAYRHGTLKKFIAREYQKAGCMRNELWLAEVEQVAKLLRRHMEQNT